MPPLRVALTATGLGIVGSAGGYYYYNSLEKQPQQITKKTFIPKHHDQRPFKLLSQQDIDTRLRAGQFVNTPQVNQVKAVYTNQLASNSPVEDTFSIHTFQQGLIAGVYDGV
ncbi:hypothetical protein G6F56_013933 [Rhizopus delemar]|nr:hypothetical protein G6F56_013933 [Rhizopus delemar]